MRKIYWLRFAYRQGKETETMHVADFPSKDALNEALARLYRYEGDRYMLASSGERKVAFHYKCQMPKQWTEFVNMRKFEDDVVEAFKLPEPSAEARAAISKMQKEEREKAAKRVPSAMDVVHPPVEIPKGWLPEKKMPRISEEDARKRIRASFDKRHPRFPHYEQIRSALLLTSAAVALGAIYLIWEWWS